MTRYYLCVKECVHSATLQHGYRGEPVCGGRLWMVRTQSGDEIAEHAQGDRERGEIGFFDGVDFI